mgnify:CR=1 FL=1
MKKAISVINLSKTFNMYNTPTDKMLEALSIGHKIRHTEFHALSDINFEIEKGEIVGIVGRNGAGKSTLLKVITGILEPTTGSVEASERISSLLELGTGFNMEYTGRENIFFYGTLMGISRKQMEEKIDDIISFAEIGDYIDQKVKTYSSGMFARLAFSCAINVEPEILIVDEILSVGDMRFQAKCFNKFKDFKKDGVTILYVGHDVGLMRSFCDRCIWLDKGKMIADGDPIFITAQFTEYMYLNDIDDFTTYKKLSASEKEKDINRGSQEKKEAENIITESSVIENAVAENLVVENTMFKGCLAHWGTEVGTITKVEMFDEAGKENNHFSPYEKVKIRISVKHKGNIDYEYASIAFSIKNKEGTDLCVKTTYDEGIFLKEKLEQVVTFETMLRLANGEYYLVVAVENRKNTNPTYYEYVEGAKFFKVYTDKKIFGIYDIDAKIKVN